MSDRPPTAVLTVAGSDPSGGAGIQADLSVFMYLGLQGFSVITAVTAQNTRGVQRIFPLGREHVSAQLESVTADFKPAVTKTGMLPTVDIIEEVGQRSARGQLGKLVIDPVLASTGGVRLSADECASYLVSNLLPRCSLVTPNLFEAEMLSGRSIRTEQDAMEAARALVDAGAGSACVTGGHWPGNPVDFVFDGQIMHKFEGQRIKTQAPVHGTGCVFSSAAAGYLARGFTVVDAVENAKTLVERAINSATTNGSGMMLPSLRSDN
ncbi:MAG: bifunctional hydroxymethylpyrimidine kinase/phosphomethylpyrimidine kinase [Actinobacteria bacterium]|nr:bifunctional hydroxymethylpyrimidine kinase/phosphomethylpyrimidine kinase [Actinomycetota bacterium]